MNFNGITLGYALDRKNNNFNLVRLLAAIAVIYGHSWALFLADNSIDPIRWLLRTEYSGSLAVYVFFFLSGIFISSSFINSKKTSRFVLMRVFRIYPALICCVLITVFVVGPIYSSLNLENYFGSGATWRYLRKNTTMIAFESTIPSVFSSNKFNLAINGSLWTIPIELKCYFFVLLTGFLGVLKRIWFSIVTFIILLVICYCGPTDATDIKPFLSFSVGIIAYNFKDRLLLDLNVLTFMSLLTAVMYLVNHDVFLHLFCLALLYATLVFGSSTFARKIVLHGDYSYGIYLYGFLVQQVIHYNYPNLSPYMSMFITIPVSFILGMLSWYFIESPSIKQGKDLANRYAN